jgi:hypothetical protein
MDRDKFNVNKIIEESILEVQESDKSLEESSDGVLEESVNPVVSTFLGEFDVKAQFESLTELAKTIHGLPRVKDAEKVFEGETECILATSLNEEGGDEITEGVVAFVSGDVEVNEVNIPQHAGLASGLGALNFARKLRRYNV